MWLFTIVTYSNCNNFTVIFDTFTYICVNIKAYIVTSPAVAFTKITATCEVLILYQCYVINQMNTGNILVYRVSQR
jgi:hypothetical protein